MTMPVYEIAMIMAGAVLLTLGASASGASRDYNFDGSIRREVLENYLSRAITMMVVMFEPGPSVNSTSAAPGCIPFSISIAATGVVDTEHK